MVHDLNTIEIAFLIGADTGITFPSLWCSPTTDGSMPKDVKKEPDQWLQVQVSDPAASQRADPYWPKKLGDRFWIRLDSKWQDGTMLASVALKVWGLTYVPWRAAVIPPPPRCRTGNALRSLWLWLCNTGVCRCTLLNRRCGKDR